MKNKLTFVILCIFWLSGCSFSETEIWWADRLAAFSQKTADKSADIYQKAIGMLPAGKQKAALCRKLGSLYLEKGDFDRAAEQLKQCPVNEQGLFAEALFKKGEYAEALGVFNRIGDKGASRYLYYYAMTLERSNLHDQALKIYQRLTNDPVYGSKALERISLISLSCNTELFSGVSPEVKDLVIKSPKAEEYPEASILYLLTDENITLGNDGKLVSEYHYVIKILNDRGKENFGEVSLQYDSTYETLEIEYARTIKPDGTVVKVGDKNVRDVSLYLNFPMYSNARARIISMPEVMPGSVLEYKVRILRTKLVNKKDFDSAYWLQADEPILLQKFSITVPKGVRLRSKVVNSEFNPGFDMEPKVTDSGDRVVYSVEAKNVPQIIPEPAMPPFSRIDTYLLASTFSSWHEIYEWWKGLYIDKMQADEEILAKVRDLIKGKNSRDAKIAAIYSFCSQDVRYVAVEYGDAGYEPHDTREIFRNKYGDCKDKAILLITMLRAAGVEAYPVLISTADSLDNQEDLPSLIFNHAIAAVKTDEGLVFMDPTASTVAFGDIPIGDQDRLALVFFPETYQLVKTPLFGADHNRSLTTTRIKLNKDESILGSRNVETWGYYRYAQRYWVKYTMPALIEESIKQRIRSISENGVLLDYSIKNADELDDPLDFSYRFSAPRYFINAGKTRIMNQMSGFDTSFVARSARHYPLDTGALRSDEDVVEVELPDNFEIKYLPKEVRAEHPWFSLISQYKKEGRKLRFSYILKVKQREIPTREYPEYKKALEDLASQLNQQVVLEVK